MLVKRFDAAQESPAPAPQLPLPFLAFNQLAVYDWAREGESGVVGPAVHCPTIFTGLLLPSVAEMISGINSLREANKLPPCSSDELVERQKSGHDPA